MGSFQNDGSGHGKVGPIARSTPEAPRPTLTRDLADFGCAILAQGMPFAAGFLPADGEAPLPARGFN